MEFLRIPKHGYYVEYGEGVDSGPYRHYFCGENRIPGAHCPNCDKPLLLMLNLDTRDPRLELSSFPTRMLPLLYCWTCDIAQDQPFAYRILSAGDVELVRFGRGRSQGQDFPYENYPVYFPGSPARLVSVPAEVEEAMEWHLSGDETKELEAQYWPTLDSLEYGKNQVGGHPDLVQLSSHAACVTCSRQALFLAALTDATLGDKGFTDNFGVQTQFHFCTACSILLATSCCD